LLLCLQSIFQIKEYPIPLRTWSGWAPVFPWWHWLTDYYFLWPLSVIFPRPIHPSNGYILHPQEASSTCASSLPPGRINRWFSETLIIIFIFIRTLPPLIRRNYPQAGCLVQPVCHWQFYLSGRGLGNSWIGRHHHLPARSTISSLYIS
jgi:hypothetical protein